MKALHTALNGIAIVAMVAAAPALSGKLSKNSRTVIRIDVAQQGAQPTAPGSIAQGTEALKDCYSPPFRRRV